MQQASYSQVLLINIWLHVYVPACVHMCQMCVCMCAHTRGHVCVRIMCMLLRRVRIIFEHDCVHVHTACMRTRVCTHVHV